LTFFSVRSSSWRWSRCSTKGQQHSQPHHSSFSMAARQSFVLLLMQNQSGLNNRRSSFAKIEKRT